MVSCHGTRVGVGTAGMQCLLTLGAIRHEFVEQVREGFVKVWNKRAATGVPLAT